jgi:nicotinamidase-related amidase
MKNKALIVIDVQKYFFNNETKPVVLRIQEFLREKSDQYSAVYFTVFRNDTNSSLWKISKWRDCTDSPDTDICEEIKEFIEVNNLFYKNMLSAFRVPEIREGLRKHHIMEVHLCGFDTDCCVLATAYDLFDTGIKPVVLERLTWSTSKNKLHKSAIQMLERNIGFVK